MNKAIAPNEESSLASLEFSCLHLSTGLEKPADYPFHTLFPEAAVHGTEILLLKLKIVVNLIRRTFFNVREVFHFFQLS